eukprot:4644519-Amphidinium_carterae.1
MRTNRNELKSSGACLRKTYLLFEAFTTLSRLPVTCACMGTLVLSTYIVLMLCRRYNAHE